MTSDDQEGLQSLGLQIAACSYEGSLFGWDLLKRRNGEGQLNMKFGFHCCAGSLKAVSTSKSGKFLVCGGMDERIHIFDLKLNKSLGELSHHKGY